MPICSSGRFFVGKFDAAFRRFQLKRPFLWGALFGLILSVAFIVSDLVIGEQIDVFQTFLMSIAAVALSSLFIGFLTKSRKKRGVID